MDNVWRIIVIELAKKKTELQREKQMLHMAKLHIVNLQRHVQECEKVLMSKEIEMINFEKI